MFNVIIIIVIISMFCLKAGELIGDLGWVKPRA